MRYALFAAALLVSTALTACPDDDDPSGGDAGITDRGAQTFPDATVQADATAQADASADASAQEDASTQPDATSQEDAAVIDDAGTPASCIDQGHFAGERYLADDNCNFCDCNADGTTTCTTRAGCNVFGGDCTYDNVGHRYGEHFPATDGCNECVCAVSGLACTRRACAPGADEGAILLETLTATCGLASFTTQNVLDEMPYKIVNAPFLYNRSGSLYPETLPDTTVDIRIVYDGGFSVCRIPMPGQEALDIEVIIEWRTADGAFDEGFRAYLRKDAGGFVDAWYINTTVDYGMLDGTYNSMCFDPGAYGFSGQIDRDGSAFGDVFKVCESDIALTVGTWEIRP